MTNGSNHWVEQQPDPWPGGNIKSFVATRDCLPSHLTIKAGRASDSCFDLIGAHQCAVHTDG